MSRFLILSTLLTVFLSKNATSQTVTNFAGIPHNDYEGTFTSDVKNKSDIYLSLPQNIEFDGNGLAYVSEKNKIRIMVTNGDAYVRAGAIGQPEFSEGYQNATGIQARFRTPSGMAFDSDNNVFIADYDNHCIRKMAKYVNVGNGQVITTFVGAAPTVGLPGYGTEGSTDGQGVNARFNGPRDIVRDASGNFYVSDEGNYTIRKITAAGYVGTLAGQAGVEGYADGTTGVKATFGRPHGLALLNNGTLVVTDRWNTCIRTVNTTTGETKTIAGPIDGPFQSHKDGTLAEARFVNPRGVVVVGNLIYVADENTIRMVDITNNKVSTIAGDPSQFEIKNGEGSEAHFTEIYGLSTDGKGFLYTVENGTFQKSNVIRQISLNDVLPIADFIANKSAALVNEEITITDQSKGATISSRKWTISGNYILVSGDLTSDKLTVKFPQTGFHTVKLEITNSFGTANKEKKDYISVSTTGNITRYDSDVFSIYPNPTSRNLNLRIPANWNTSELFITVFNQLGEQVLVSNYTQSLDVAHFSSGVYFMTITGKEVNAAQRFIVR